MAAAAVNDSARTAAALRRIAASGAELRAWGMVNPVVDGLIGLRQSVFPWSNVATAPAVVDALKQVDAAIAITRTEAAKVLQGM